MAEVVRRRRRLARAAALLPGVLMGLAMTAGPWSLRTVRGGSMAPALLPGDVCVLRQGARGVGPGDIVLFDKEGWPGGVLHRVVRELPDGRFETRGDANPVPDLDPVPRERVLGVCVAVLPAGRAAHFLASLRGGTLPGQLDSQRR